MRLPRSRTRLRRRIANNVAPVARLSAGVSRKNHSPGSTYPILQRTRSVGRWREIFADIRFELGELHVLMMAGTAK
jgi:hypothetical protein